jgi:hypothetical protein
VTQQTVSDPVGGEQPPVAVDPLVEGAPLDPAADRAFAEEVQRIDHGQHWDPSTAQSGVERSPYQPPVPPAGLRMTQPRPPPVQREELPPIIETPRALPSSKLNSLEDLYRAFPQIGSDGLTFLRVERRAPKTWGGAVVSGILKDMHEQISVNDFKEKFGGHDYIVMVMGPEMARSDDDLTQPKIRELARLRLQFPGPPAYGTTPINPDEDDPMLRGAQVQGGYPRGLPMGTSPEVEIRRMELEAEERQRQSAEVKNLSEKYGTLVTEAGKAPEQVLRAIDSVQERSFTEMKASHEAVATHLREANTKLLENREQLERTIRELQTEMVAVKTKAAEDVRNGETKLVTDLKERYAGEFVETNKRHTAEITDLKERHNRDLNELRERLATEVKRVADESRTKLDDMQRQHLREQTDERARNLELMNQVRTDSRERIEQMKSDFARAETNLREDYKTRMTELQHNTDREIKSVKDERDRTIESIRSTSAGEAKWTEKTADQRIKILEAECARHETKNESLERENQALRDKQNVPLEQQIERAQHLAGMTGMIRAEDAPAAAGEEADLDWKKMGMKLVGGLLEKSPEILQKVGEIRQQNAAVAAQQRQAVPQNGRPAAPQLPTQMTRQPMQPQQQRRVAPPPGMSGAPTPAWNAAAGPTPGGMHGAPPPYMGPPPSGASGPVPGPMQRPAVVYAPTPQGPQVAPAQGAQGPAVTQGSPLQPPPPPQQPGATAPAPEPEMPTQWMAGPTAPAPAAQPAATGGIDLGNPQQIEQAVVRFVGELDGAIRDQVLSPVAFANLFIGEVGPEMASRLLQMIPPDQVIATVAGLPDGDRSQIVTREGQKYVRAVWAAAGEALGLVAA